MLFQKRKILFVLICSAIPAMNVGSALSANAALQAEIDILGIGEEIISPHLIGTNLFVANEADIVTPKRQNHLLLLDSSRAHVSNNLQMVERCRDVRMGALRYPGAEDSERYHWAEAIGPILERPMGVKLEGRQYRQFFGTVELARFAESIGSDIVLTVNYQKGSIEEATNWVAFCNRPVPEKVDSAWKEASYNAGQKIRPGYYAWLRGANDLVKPICVRYWEIGNENYFTKDTAYIQKAHAFAKAMKEVDPSIKIGVTGDPFLRFQGKQFEKKPYLDPSLIDNIVLHIYARPDRLPPVTKFFSNGCSDRCFDVSLSGEYEIQIDAVGTCALGCPEMEVTVDGQTERHVAAPNHQKGITIGKVLSQGSHSIQLCFVNDRLIPKVGDRNLYVKSVKIKGRQDTSGQEIWNTDGVAEQFLAANNYLIERQIERIRAAYPDQTVIITEASTRFGGGKKIDRSMHRENMTLKSSLWYAGLINTAIRQNIPVLCHFALIGNRLGFGMIRPDNSVTPHYQVMKLYADHCGKRKVDLRIQSKTYRVPLSETSQMGREVQEIQFIDAVSSYNPDNGQIAITMLNRHPSQAVDVKFSFPKGLPIRDSQYVQELYTESVEETKTINADGQKENFFERRFTTHNEAGKLLVKPASIVHVSWKSK